MKPVVVIGAGGHARSLTAMAPEEFKPALCVAPEQVMSLTHAGDDESFLADSRYADYPLILGIGATGDCSMAKRRSVIDRYAGREFVTVIAPDAIVEKDSVVGKGTAIFHAAVVNTGAFIGDHVIVNTGAIVEHDVTIGSNTFIGPGAIVLGGVTVGRDVYIGAGCCLRQGITIADGVSVAMGSVVSKDLTVPGFYAGNPARKLR